MLANDESEVAGAISPQLLIERDRLALAISRLVEVHFGRGFPFLGIPVRHRAQPAHPLVESEQRSLTLLWAVVSVEENQNGRHLLVVRGAGDRQKRRLGEA